MTVYYEQFHLEGLALQRCFSYVSSCRSRQRRLVEGGGRTGAHKTVTRSAHPDGTQPQLIDPDSLLQHETKTTVSLHPAFAGRPKDSKDPVSRLSIKEQRSASTSSDLCSTPTDTDANRTGSFSLRTRRGLRHASTSVSGFTSSAWKRMDS